MTLSPQTYAELNASFGYYVAFTRKAMVYPGAGTGNKAEISYVCMGLAGEAGEAIDALKKHVRIVDESLGHAQIHPEVREKAIIELGDTMWYIARLCDILNCPMGEILSLNVEKLEARIAGGTIASLSRDIDVYAIGIKDSQGGHGMVDGPNPDITVMLAQEGEKGAYILRMRGEPNAEWEETFEWVGGKQGWHFIKGF